MQTRELDPNNLQDNEDWYGNNAAFLCPHCGRVFLVSGHFYKKGRDCPKCGKSFGIVQGGKESGGTAELRW